MRNSCYQTLPFDLACIKCKEVKPVSEFSHLHAGDYVCKPCMLIRHKQWRDKNPDKLMNYQEGAKRRDATFRGHISRIGNMAKGRAKEAGLPFDLSLGHLWQLLHNQNYRCAISGTQFAIIKGQGRSAPYPFNPSVDRIIPGKGYVKDNCRLVCHWVNIMKYTRSDDELAKMCRTILQNGQFAESLPAFTFCG